MTNLIFRPGSTYISIILLCPWTGGLCIIFLALTKQQFNWEAVGQTSLEKLKFRGDPAVGHDYCFTFAAV